MGQNELIRLVLNPVNSLYTVHGVRARRRPRQDVSLDFFRFENDDEEEDD